VIEQQFRAGRQLSSRGEHCMNADLGAPGAFEDKLEPPGRHVACSHEQGHLPGARLFPVETAHEQARTVSTRVDAPIVVYCASATCKNSDVVAKLLDDVGFQNVSVYKGGKADWQSAGRPLE
jgi:3-mercaptopyruvate sulfurtransferase SseA